MIGLDAFKNRLNQLNTQYGDSRGGLSGVLNNAKQLMPNISTRIEDLRGIWGAPQAQPGRPVQNWAPAQPGVDAGTLKRWRENQGKPGFTGGTKPLPMGNAVQLPGKFDPSRISILKGMFGVK